MPFDCFADDVLYTVTEGYKEFRSKLSLLYHSSILAIVEISVENNTETHATSPRRETNSQLDAPFNVVWECWATQSMLAWHRLRGDGCTMKEIARRIYEEKVIQIKVKAGFYFSGVHILVMLRDGLIMTVMRPKGANEHVLQNGLCFVAHFARNMESLKVDLARLL